jgi:aspartyl-tRNA synthetase
MVMLLVKADSIREVMAFPKVKDASCLMSGAPNVVDDVQLQELCISIEKPEEDEEDVALTE